MRLNALNLSLCRVPAFGMNDELTTIWPELKIKIKIASPAFYEQISSVEANELSTLPEKIKFTIWKYFNRAKYRATPFANFASYTVVPIKHKSERLKIEAQMQCHQFINWQAKETLSSDSKANLKKANWLYSNTSSYQVDAEIRYLRLNEGIFELASVDVFPELISMITYCAVKRNKSAVYNFMNSEHKLDEKQCKDLIQQLLNLQLLHTDQTANITGEDYFERLNFPVNDTYENYTLAERKLLAGGLDYAKSLDIAEALAFIAKQVPKWQNTSLQNFKNAFLKKFEHQEVSLAIAMDPELGIGYGNLAQYEATDELVEQLENASNKQIDSRLVQYTSMHQFLINALMENKFIALENFEAETIKSSHLPNSLSVICQFYKGNSVIGHAGGCTANALLGRFTLGNAALEAHCKEIAEREQNANPDVVFFDIPYQAETHVDNVNRRKNCYAHELPILTWSCQTEPLDFNDIMVTVQADEIILYSKRLGKRLIPRLASAYNYSRSDLAVYRFLCDLQHQSIQTNLTFDIQTYLPGLKHYPRVSYKKVILSPAKWLMPKSIYQHKNNHRNSLDELSLWLKQKDINFLVKIGISDQTLCFNPSVTTDLLALLNYCKQQGDRPLYLVEALIDEEDSLIDENGKKFMAEFVINYYHDEQIYNEIRPQNILSIEHKEPIQAHYLPCAEWLYFEIFVNPSKSNALLCNEIICLLKTHKSDILQWFFIRYTENGKHLRLRLRVRDSAKRSLIIDNVNQLLTTPMLKGMVSDVSIKTYYPEIARYGKTRITHVEHFFYLDSKYVLSLLSKAPDTNRLYQLSLCFLKKILNVCFPSISDRLSFAKQMAGLFAAEFAIDQNGFKKINQLYAAIKKEKHMLFNQSESSFKHLENCAQSIFMLCAETEKSKMLADLIHMHVNRLFNDRQRLHEAICYQFLYKQMLTEQARLTAQAEHPASA